jgi:DNA-binding transcriptional regulator YiaG
MRLRPGCRLPHRGAVAEILEIPPARLIELLKTPPAPHPISPLKRMRLTTGLKPRHVAARLLVSSSLLGRWEHGRARPSWPHLRRLAAIYKRSLSEVAGAVGVTQPPHLDHRIWTADNIGNILRDIRIWRGESIHAVATRVGVHWQTLQRWECGRRRAPPENAATT